MANQFYILWFGNRLVSFAMGLDFLAATYLWSRRLFRYNYYELFTLIFNLEYSRPLGSYFNVSVVYRLFLSSCTFLKNSLIRWVGHRLVILEGLYKSKLFFVPMWNLWSAVGFCVFNVHGDTLWLFLKTFRSIELQAGISICRSGLVQVVDATSLIQFMDTWFFHADTGSEAVRRRGA